MPGKNSKKPIKGFEQLGTRREEIRTVAAPMHAPSKNPTRAEIEARNAEAVTKIKTHFEFYTRDVVRGLQTHAEAEAFLISYRGAQNASGTNAAARMLFLELYLAN